MSESNLSRLVAAYEHVGSDSLDVLYELDVEELQDLEDTLEGLLDNCQTVRDVKE